MFDHIGVFVTDLATSVRFYQAALEPLGLVMGSSDESSAGFGPKGSPKLWLFPRKERTERLHLAFEAKDRAAVAAFHRAALAAGGKDNGGPGLRTDYSPTYYGAFVIDPDGNNVEAVCYTE